MLEKGRELNIIKKPGSQKSREQQGPLKLTFAGEHYLAIPARAGNNICIGGKVDVMNIGECLVIGNLVVDREQYLVISCDCKENAYPSNGDMWEILTDRELQIAILVSRGKINKQIAHQLSISEYTVATYMRRIFAKLGVSSRSAMVAYLMESLSGR